MSIQEKKHFKNEKVYDLPRPLHWALGVETTRISYFYSHFPRPKEYASTNCLMALVIELQFALKAPFEFQGFLSPSHYCNPLASGKPTRETSWSQRAEARWKGRWGRNRATAKSAARAGPGLRRRGRPRPSASLAPPRAPRPRTQARARPNA